MKFDENSLKKYYLSEQELQYTRESSSQLSLKANEFFLQSGKVCHYVGIVTKGLLREYIYDDNGNEITTRFYPEGAMIITFDSFNNRIPAKENIRAIEDSELRIRSFEKQQELYKLVPAWNQICIDIAGGMSHEIAERSRLLQSMSASERYQDFCKKNPELLQRVNLGHIASYIGVDIATLSRIRKKK